MANYKDIKYQFPTSAVTSGTGVIYKAVWANQAASSKETQLHGIGINY